MTKIHLNYDEKQNNGIIFNNKYTNGALYNGAEFKPSLSFQYDSMQYSEVFDTLDYVELAGVKRAMTPAEQNEVKAVAINWVQPLGQEGNPTLEQAQGFKLNELTNAFSAEVHAITSNAQDHEMVSWRKQEDEARAYTADNTAATPFIDAQVATRQLETKDELVAKIIANADAYQVAYAKLLGKYQNLSNAVSIATTVKDVEAVVW